jgi:hypothetical protein
MKNLLLTMVVFSILLLIGCQDHTNVVGPPLKDSYGKNDLSKMTILTQIEEIVPFSSTRFIPCINGGAGEDVVVSGTAKNTWTEFLDGNEGYHYRSSFQTLEYGAIGQVTGDIYQGVGGKERQNVNVGFTGFPVSANFTANYNFHGPHNNFRETVRSMIVLNANGELKVNFQTVSIDCN